MDFSTKVSHFFFMAVFLAVSDCSNGQEICNDGAEFWPHPDCKFYYHCSGGVPVLRECPPTLYGNQNLVVCDHPLNVPECVGGTRPPPSTTTTRPTTTTEAPHHQIIRIRRPSTNTAITVEERKLDNGTILHTASFGGVGCSDTAQIWKMVHIEGTNTTMFLSALSGGGIDMFQYAMFSEYGIRVPFLYNIDDTYYNPYWILHPVPGQPSTRVVLQSLAYTDMDTVMAYDPAAGFYDLSLLPLNSSDPSQWFDLEWC
ncbi:uncharacterized protein LOC110856597 [Folsomia candida]|uniref:Endochitinase n=1 Tax=Folsomia candida TaxID=158441 RepID=A0A226DLR3_FOLCA|nr:uncharacterized protein LOC110856597 [Folsomia candida]OXA46163.1 Endochitinase [Folsomia candida]